AFSLLTLNISCGDDFVDRTPAYSIDSENYFNSQQDYEYALIAVYDILQSTYVNVLLGEIASDNTFSGGESATDVPGFQQIDDMTHTPVNPNLKNVWDWMFAGVNRANYILEFQDKTDFEGKEHIIAQTRFLRAYFHFELVKWFGGIPMKGDARFVVGDEISLPRATPAEVYASIEADLLYAIDNLDPEAPSEQGRVTVGAARALLGKAYLYQKKYAESAAVLETLIQSGSYSLVANYSTIFENAGENGPESVFEVQYTDSEGAGFGCLQCSEGNVAVGFNSPRNFDGPIYFSGYSFNVPTQEAYDAFEAGDGRRDVAILDIAAFAAANPTWNNNAGVTYGVLTGLFIALYTINDTAGVKHYSLAPLTFTFVTNLFSSVLLLPFMIGQKAEIKREITEHKWHITAIAFLSPAAYILVLIALKYAPLTVVAPARETSILLGVFFGSKVFAEGDVKRRLIASFLILGGIVALSLG
ncbi:MAG: hypothetical protein EOP54_21385, partial [Sphingobacteriales bacterium]